MRIIFCAVLLLGGCTSTGPVLTTRDGGVGSDARVSDAGPTDDGALPDDGDTREDGGPGDAGTGCFTLPPLYPGSLCGTADDPCTVRENVLVDAPHFRNDAPSIHVHGDDVTVMYSIAEGGYEGYIAEASRDFAPQRLPIPVATVSTSKRGLLIGLTGDGAYGITLGFPLCGWAGAGTLRGSSGASSLAVDDGQCVHVAYGRESGEIAYAFMPWLGEWTETTLATGGAASPFAAVALGPDPGSAREAMPHFAYRHADAGGGGVYWHVVPGERELVAGSATTSISLAPVRMRVVGGEPHLLFRSDGTGDVVYSRRTPSGFLPITLASDTGDGCPDPTAPDQSCDYTRVTHHVVDLETSGTGDVRLFFGEITETGRLTSTCSGGPGPGMMCMWNGTPTRTGRLMMAVPGAAPVSVADGIAPASGTATVDALGRIHLALYTREPGTDDLGTRYVLLSGSGPTCLPERVDFPMGGRLAEGSLCDEIQVCVPDAAGASRVMAASPSFTCEPGACEGGGYLCRYATSVLDGAEIAEVCAVTLLEPPADSITCRIFL